MYSKKKFIYFIYRVTYGILHYLILAIDIFFAWGGWSYNIVYSNF